jgi:hypothetical protein
MTWYRVSRYDVKIERVEVVRETSQYIVRKREYFGKETEERVRKAGEYFPSLDLAKQAIQTKLEAQIRYAKISIDQAELGLKKLEEITDEKLIQDSLSGKKFI